MNTDDPFYDQGDCLTPTLIAIICAGIGVIMLVSAMVIL